MTLKNEFKKPSSNQVLLQKIRETRLVGADDTLVCLRPSYTKRIGDLVIFHPAKYGTRP